MPSEFGDGAVHSFDDCAPLCSSEDHHGGPDIASTHDRCRGGTIIKASWIWPLCFEGLWQRRGIRRAGVPNHVFAALALALLSVGGVFAIVTLTYAGSARLDLWAQDFRTSAASDHVNVQNQVLPGVAQHTVEPGPIQWPVVEVPPGERMQVCDGCNFFVALVVESATAGGWGQWGHNLLGALSRMNVEVRRPPELPDEKTVAIILQGLDGVAMDWLRKIGPDSCFRQNRRIFLGPFASSVWGNATAQRLERLQGTVIFHDNSHATANCQKRVAELDAGINNIGCATAETGVDLQSFIPKGSSTPTPREERTLPAVYLKSYGGIHINGTGFRALLKSAGVHNYALVQTTRGGPEWFTQYQYFTALSNAPYLIAFTPGDNYGYFLIEAASFDVPVFLIEHGGPPEWFSAEFGHHVKIPSDWQQPSETLISELESFIAKATSGGFSPREAAVRHGLGWEGAAQRFLNLTQPLRPSGCHFESLEGQK